MDQPSIKCPACSMVSYNENDIREGYCGNCHEYTSPKGLIPTAESQGLFSKTYDPLDTADVIVNVTRGENELLIEVQQGCNHDYPTVLGKGDHRGSFCSNCGQSV